jgi:PmbA protein
VAVPGVTIGDDALDPGTIGAPFDFEGVPRRRVDLIRDGVFLDAVYDRRTGKEAGRGSTGHALPAPNPDGPYPLNLAMTPGDATLEQMIAATERGVLVTRFHYSNVVNPVESSITGMTRDGTFLIEHGEVVRPVVNFRFTQSILAALSTVSMVGDRAELASEFFFSASRVPALKIEEFNFSGRSDH